MSRSINLGLTVCCTISSAWFAAQGKMGQAVIAGLIALLNFAVWTARGPDENKKVSVDTQD